MARGGGTIEATGPMKKLLDSLFDFLFAHHHIQQFGHAEQAADLDQQGAKFFGGVADQSGIEEIAPDTNLKSQPAKNPLQQVNPHRPALVIAATAGKAQLAVVGSTLTTAQAIDQSKMKTKTHVEVEIVGANHRIGGEILGAAGGDTPGQGHVAKPLPVEMEVALPVDLRMTQSLPEGEKGGGPEGFGCHWPLAAYDLFDTWKPSSEKDLLDAHRILMSGLIDEAGLYRHGGVGVMAGSQVIHMAPPANRVPQLMVDLFGWLAATDAHPLIASAVFHYEFEFIHPFADGNGRMGRLWQSLILAHWNPLFADIPVESLIFEHQAEYYQALQESTRQADSAPFIAFMLRMILDTVTASAPQVSPQVSPQVKELLAALQGEMGREALQSALGLSDRKSFRARYLKPALKAGLIEMTIPDKPNSRLQKYRLTDKVRQWLAQHGGG